jgi:hypothetical protein
VAAPALASVADNMHDHPVSVWWVCEEGWRFVLDARSCKSGSALTAPAEPERLVGIRIDCRACGTVAATCCTRNRPSQSGEERQSKSRPQPAKDQVGAFPKSPIVFFKQRPDTE